MDPDSLIQGFSTAYDLVASEYGWSDERIGNLPVARLRQIVANIQVRKWSAERQRRIDISWMTRTIAMYIAMGYWIKEDEPNKPLEFARGLSLDDIEREILKIMEETPDAPKENQAGSFERFMLAFGNGVQRG